MFRKLLFFVPVIIGGLAVYWVSSQRQPPMRAEPAEIVRSVRFIEVQPIDLIPRVSGFGTVSPAKTWKAVVQAAGEIEFVHPDLRRGAILEGGTEIIRISPADYELAIARAEANIERIDAELAEFELTEENTRASLEIEREVLQLQERDMARRERLAEAGTISSTVLEQEKRETLAQRKKVQDLENTLKLIPAQRRSLESQRRLNRLELDQAKLNLQRTVITLPFSARIAEASAEIAQFAQTGTTLAVADGLQTAEVEAQVPLSQFAAFIRVATRKGASRPGLTAEGIRQVIDEMGFEATIRLNAAGTDAEWPAVFSRISDTIDPKTRTVGVFVSASGTWENAIPGQRPPLSKGLFVEVLLEAKPLEDVIAVPRSAIVDGKVPVMDQDDRLALRDIEIGIEQRDLAIVSSGLIAGDRVVVSDVVPAIPGMKLRGTQDEALWTTLKKQASGNPTADGGGAARPEGTAYGDD